MLCFCFSSSRCNIVNDPLWKLVHYSIPLYSQEENDTSDMKDSVESSDSSNSSDSDSDSDGDGDGDSDGDNETGQKKFFRIDDMKYSRPIGLFTQLPVILFNTESLMQLIRSVHHVEPNTVASEPESEIENVQSTLPLAIVQALSLLYPWGIDERIDLAVCSNRDPNVYNETLQMPTSGKLGLVSFLQSSQFFCSTVGLVGNTNEIKERSENRTNQAVSSPWPITQFTNILGHRSSQYDIHHHHHHHHHQEEESRRSHQEPQDYNNRRLSQQNHRQIHQPTAQRVATQEFSKEDEALTSIDEVIADFAQGLKTTAPNTADEKFSGSKPSPSESAKAPFPAATPLHTQVQDIRHKNDMTPKSDNLELCLTLYTPIARGESRWKISNRVTAEHLISLVACLLCAMHNLQYTQV